jgi:hypothetical protein
MLGMVVGSSGLMVLSTLAEGARDKIQFLFGKGSFGNAEMAGAIGFARG